MQIEAEFCYDTINIEGNKVDLQSNSNKIINIGFGKPEVLLEKKQETIKKLQEEGKKGKADKTKTSKKSEVSKKGVKDGVMNVLPEDQVYHVAKYNVMLNKKFLKDIILISTFIE